MYVRELQNLTVWVDEEINAKRVLKLYSALYNIINSNAQASNQKQPFEEQKKNLINTLRTISLLRLTEEQIALLTSLGIANNVGEEGAKNVEDMLVLHPLDIATAASKIQTMHREIEQGVKRFEQIKAALQGIAQAEPVERDEVLLRVRFDRNAKIQNIVELKDWSETWFNIGRGIAMLHDAAPEDVRVVGAETGSVILYLAVTYGLAKTTSAILLECLKVASRYMEVRMQAEQVRALKLNNDKIAEEIEKAAEKEREKTVATIVAQVIKQSGRHVDGEKNVALTRSVEKLVAFIEKGGKVDCIPPKALADNTDGNDVELKRQSQELLKNFEEIRKLESKVELLEHKQTADAEGPPSA